MGCAEVHSPTIGVRGRNDFDLPLVDSEALPVDGNPAEEFLMPQVREDQLGPRD